MRALRDAERRIVDQPSVTLLAVLDYAAARAAGGAGVHTSRHDRSFRRSSPARLLRIRSRGGCALPDTVREACERMIRIDRSGSDDRRGREAALAARRAGAREYAARMAYAIEREREEEARRRRAMKEAGVTETPAEAEAATDRVDARIAVYQQRNPPRLRGSRPRPGRRANGRSGRAGRRAGASRAGRRAGAGRAGRRREQVRYRPRRRADRGLSAGNAASTRKPTSARRATDEAVAPEGAREQVARGSRSRRRTVARWDALTIAWQVHARRWGRTILTPTPETAPRFAERLVLIDRGKRGGTLSAYGKADLE